MTARKTLVTSLAVSAALVIGGAGTASARDRVVKVRDACDPVTFNAALGAGACEPGSRGSRVAFGDLLATAAETGAHPKWRFDRERVTLDEGDTLVARYDRGGEGHTFTEVAAYGPGCVPELNEVVGAEGPPAADCSLIPATLVAPGVPALEIDDLARGTHRFECLIHPWMRTTVTVR